ncbi:MAG: cytochrome P450 [Proteobacteria bacterium]|nr:cytochrome P450 [Pseudomonadota bacterium]
MDPSLDFPLDDAEFLLGDPYPAFRLLRERSPVHWYEKGGFWALTRHADVQYVSRSPRLFRSSRGVLISQIDQMGSGTDDEMPPSIIMMDPPLHNRFRKLVMKVFTPRMVSNLEPRVREIARECLDPILAGETVDFVERVAEPLPMLVIAELLGVPTTDRADFKRWSDAMVDAGGSGVNPDNQANMAELFAYLGQKIEERDRDPRDDLLSALLRAEIDGERLDAREVLMFCMTLLVAGNETTRNLISGGAYELMRAPDQLRKLAGDPSRAAVEQAIEEMLRWVAPVRHFMRAATRDTELRGERIAEGQFVVLYYASANRDETVFGPDPDPERFDIARRPGPHLSFGFGEHMCMGASLARLEACVIFDELLARFPRFELAGDPTWLRSILMNSITTMPVVFAR